MLIYQVDNGADNSGKKPSGGVSILAYIASSISVVVANPITFYSNVNIGAVIDQSGQSGDLYNYYWTSYSRGTDGSGWPSENPNWHNLYLDSYIPLRHKSIYDPCPYGYRIPSNGTYNQFIAHAGWIKGSCIGGVVIMDTWNSTTGGMRNTSVFERSGGWILSQSSIVSSNNAAYIYDINSNQKSYPNTSYAKSYGMSVRCIEECELLPDTTEAKANSHHAWHSLNRNYI